MKEEALKLADELQDYMTSLGWETHQAPNMIRRLVAENNFLKDWRDTWAPHINPLKQTKPQEWQYLTDDEIKEIIGSYGTGAGGYGNGVGGNNLGGYTRELFDKIEAKIREKNDS